MAKITKETITAALAAKKRVFVLNEYGEATQIKSASKVSQEDIEAFRVRIEKDAKPGFVAGKMVDAGDGKKVFMPFDHNGMLVAELNAGPRKTPIAAKNLAAKLGGNAVAQVTNPLVYDKDNALISYPATLVSVEEF